ncbi:ferredoxin [Clostridium sp. YIM B02515]|uniref:Ferredoxin n=1 Tax=Clostridium rhizosphaerae TaxID=2803861 RepID=A0ABS1TCW7_9CLOT|nr:ferredoxin [Clostridium rhizosphaerae]
MDEEILNSQVADAKDAANSCPVNAITVE